MATNDRAERASLLQDLSSSLNPDRMDAARGAYSDKDAAASRLVHDGIGVNVENHGEEGSEYIKSLVYGGLDGIVTTFAIVAAGAGANLGVGVITLMGFAGLVADGISMGLGDFFSSLAELDYAIIEKNREKWEFDHFPDGEKKEMVDIYCDKFGFTATDARLVVDLYAKYPGPFVDLMMVQELGLNPPDEESRSTAWKNGLVTLFSFWGFGSVGLWAYLILYWASPASPVPKSFMAVQFVVSAIAVLVALFGLGAFKARFTAQGKICSGLEMCLNGTIASLSAYLVSWGLDVIVAKETCVCTTLAPTP